MKKMKIIYSKHIPFKGYTAMTLFNWIIIREELKDRIGNRTINHESIHQAQAYDFGIGFFGYFLYMIEWFLKLPWFILGYKPYRSISFEQEAYNRDCDYDYLDSRKRFAWLKYVFKMTKKG